MTEENENVGIEQPQGGVVSDVSAVSDDDVQKPIYNKIQVEDVVKREKAKAYERGKREALMELQQQAPQDVQAQQSMPQQAQAPQSVQSLGGIAQLTPEQVQQMIAEQAPQVLQAHVKQAKQNNMINNFVAKMQAAEQKYPGLEAELNNLNYDDPRMHAFIEMANNAENTGEIMKEVIDNPTKMESLLNMAYNQPYQAQKALASLSESIKVNQNALAQEAQARDPMSQLKPSASAGLIDGNAVSVRDLRKMLSKR